MGSHVSCLCTHKCVSTDENYLCTAMSTYNKTLMHSINPVRVDQTDESYLEFLPNREYFDYNEPANNS